MLTTTTLMQLSQTTTVFTRDVLTKELVTMMRLQTLMMDHVNTQLMLDVQLRELVTTMQKQQSKVETVPTLTQAMIVMVTV